MRILSITLAAALLATVAASQTTCGLPGVTVTISPTNPAPGQTITVMLANNSGQTVTLTSSCTYRSVHVGSCTGKAVFSPLCLQVLTPIPSGQSRSMTWDQKDDNGVPVQPGIYAFSIRYFDAQNAPHDCCPRVAIGCGAFVAYGSGCPDTTGTVPTLSGSGCLAGGQQFGLAVANGPPNAAGLLAFGLGRGSVPVTPACSIDIAPLTNALIPIMLSNSGSFSTMLTVPPFSPSVNLDVQVAALDTRGAGPVLSLTNALELQIP